MNPKLEKVIGLLQETAEYFRECRSNASFASKAENHFWELQNAANEAVNLLKEQDDQIEQLEHDLDVTQNNLNYYVNGND